MPVSAAIRLGLGKMRRSFLRMLSACADDSQAVERCSARTRGAFFRATNQRKPKPLPRRPPPSRIGQIAVASISDYGNEITYSCETRNRLRPGVPIQFDAAAQGIPNCGASPSWVKSEISILRTRGSHTRGRSPKPPKSRMNP